MNTSYTTGVLPKRATSFLACLLLGFCGSAMAHEGHYHEDAEAPSPAAAPAPHPVLDAPQLEVVARREGRDVVFYVDDYTTNAPLDGLQLTLRSGSSTLQAAGGEGHYRVPAELLPSVGEQTLDLSVYGAGVDAQLQVQLPAAEKHDAAPLTETPPPLLSRLTGAALILGLLLAAWRLRRRRAPQAGREARTA
jgi:hypothetical protein